MNNNVVEKTLKSIDNIDRLSDLAAISIYNTSHEAIDKFDVMQEHATPEYVEGEFVQESLLTGVLIGAGIIGVAISAFLIIKKIIESKAKGDPNAAPNSIKGVDLRNPDDIDKAFTKWEKEYFGKYPDMVIENIKGASPSALGTYAETLTKETNDFITSVNDIIESFMSGTDKNMATDEQMVQQMHEFAESLKGAINIDQLEAANITKDTIGILKSNAISIAKSFRDFDNKINESIKTFEARSKQQHADSEDIKNANETMIKNFSNALKSKAKEIGAIMDSIRSIFEGFQTAIENKVKEAEGQAKTEQQQQDNTGLTLEQKQLIIKKVQARVPEADEHNISDEIARFGVAKSEQELRSLLDAEFEAMESNPNNGSKDSFKRMAAVASEIAQIKGFNWNDSVSTLYNLNALVPGEVTENSEKHEETPETPEGTPEAEPKNQNTDEASAENAEKENTEKKDETETKQSSVDSTKNVLNDDALLTAYADKRFGGNKEQAKQHAEYLQKLDAKTFKNNIMKQVFVNVLIDHKQSGLNEAIDDIYNNYMSDFKDANISPDESMNDINAIHLSEDEINKLRQIFSRLSIGKNFSDKYFCQRLADMIKDNSGNEFDAAMNRLESGFPPFNDIKDFKTEIEQNMRVFNKQFSDNPEENDLNNIQFTITNMSMDGLFNWAKQKYDTPYAVNRYELACKLARNALHLNDKFVPKPKELNGETPESEKPSSPSNSSTGSGSKQPTGKPAATKQRTGTKQQPVRKPVNKSGSGSKQQSAKKPGVLENLRQFIGL